MSIKKLKGLATLNTIRGNNNHNSNSSLVFFLLIFFIFYLLLFISISYIEKKRRSIHANRAGTKGFRAPEIILRERYQTGGNEKEGIKGKKVNNKDFVLTFDFFLFFLSH